MRNVFSVLFTLFLFCNTSIFAIVTKEVRFAFLTDIHVTPKAESEKILREIVKEINSQSLDFVILTGDLANNGTDLELNTVKNILSGLDIPCHVIPGNHETTWSESACMTFLQLFKEDRFLFEYEDYLFVGFASGPYMKMGDGHVKEEDIHWLKQNLQAHHAKEKKLIVAVHYPLSEGLDNWHKITPILQEYNARFALCGHAHRLSLHNFDGTPGIMGRPSLKSGSTIGGYNLVTLRNDSVIVIEKELGITPTKDFTAFSLNNKEIIKNLPAPIPPDYSINSQYPLVEAKEIITDSASIFTGTAIFENILVYGNSKGEIIAWDIKKNKELWRKKYSGSIYSTPSILNGKVYVGTVSGYLHCLSLKNGKSLHEYNLEKPIIGEAGQDGVNLYVTSGNVLYKIDTDKKEIRWRNSNIEGQLQGKPCIGTNEIITGAWDKHLYCIEKTTGKLRWTWNNGREGVLYSPANIVPAISNGKVFIVAPDRYMTAIDLESGQTVWRTNQYKVRESMGISSDGQSVYAKLMNDSILCVSTAGDEFKEEWAVNAGFGYEHNPCPILEYQGIIYAGGRNGLLVAIEPKTQQIKFKYKCGNSEINKITPDKNEGVWVTLVEGKVLYIK